MDLLVEADLQHLVVLQVFQVLQELQVGHLVLQVLMDLQVGVVHLVLLGLVV
jgi:hypothetical protein